MKSYKFFFYAFMAVAVCTGFASCSSNDDDDEQPGTPLWVGELSDPAYEADAAAYKITNSTTYGMIELTASGNYLIAPPEGSSSGYNAPVAVASSSRTLFAADAAPRSREYYDEYGIFGKYTKLSDGRYNLEGFGTLTIIDNSTLDVTLENGSQLSLDVVKLPNVESNPLNNRLCRTWYVQSGINSIYDVDGNLIEQKTFTGSELRENYMQYVVVTKAGTFVQVDWDGQSEGFGEWNWYDKGSQTFHYRFTDDEYSDQGLVQVAFQNDKAFFIETIHEYDDYGHEIILVMQTNTVAR